MDSHSVDFQQQDLSVIKFNRILQQIKTGLLQNYPFESGGLVFSNGEVCFYKSKKDHCHSYLPSFQFYKDLLVKDVWFSFHSHLHLLKQSDDDIFFIKNYNIPIIIYSLNYNCFLSVNTKNETNYFTWPVEEGRLPVF